MNESILIIGGMGVGKSTISKLIADKLNIPYKSMDAYRCDYVKDFREYDFETQLELRKKYGFKREKDYLKPWIDKAFNDFLEKLDEPCVIDAGGLNTYEISDELLEKIKNIKNIVLLKNDNIDEILARRDVDKNSDLGEIYINTNNNPVNYELAKIVMDVHGDKEEIADEIISKLQTKKTLI